MIHKSRFKEWLQTARHPDDWRFQVCCNGPNENYIDLVSPFGKTNSSIKFCLPVKLKLPGTVFRMGPPPRRMLSYRATTSVSENILLLILELHQSMICTFSSSFRSSLPPLSVKSYRHSNITCFFSRYWSFMWLPIEMQREFCHLIAHEVSQF